MILLYSTERLNEFRFKVKQIESDLGKKDFSKVLC